MAGEYYMYIIQSNNDWFYTGITNNPERRFKEHKGGYGSKFLKARGFKDVLFVIKVENRSIATKLEIRLKHLNRRGKIKFMHENNDKNLIFTCFKRLCKELRGSGISI